MYTRVALGHINKGWQALSGMEMCDMTHQLAGTERVKEEMERLSDRTELE